MVERKLNSVQRQIFNFHIRSSSSSIPPISAFSTLTDSEINLPQLFRGESDNFGGGKEILLWWKENFNSVQQIFNFSPTSNKLGCIITTLRSELSRPENRGGMVVEERKSHINMMELRAAELAIMSFTLKEDAI